MISFDEATHTYTIDGDTSYISVTTLLSGWFKPFDADKTIRKMRANPSWLSSKYYGMTDEDIKRLWNDNGNAAAKLGTELHACIEAYFKGSPTPQDTIEYGYFIDFVESFRLNTHEVEWRVCYPPYKMVGTIDYASRNDDGTIDLYDWKRSTELTQSYDYCILDGLTHIPSSKYWKYTLQLNLYRFIIEKMGFNVRKMFIVCFHPSHLGFQKHEVAEISLEKILNKCRG